MCFNTTEKQRVERIGVDLTVFIFEWYHDREKYEEEIVLISLIGRRLAKYTSRYREVNPDKLLGQTEKMLRRVAILMSPFRENCSKGIISSSLLNTCFTIK